MGRRVKRITITDPGGIEANRDHGKTYELREMDAVTGEKWAMRVLNGAMRSGAQLGDIEPVTGMAGLAGLGILAVAAIGRMNWDLAEPLIDEMMACVKPVTPDGTMVRDRLLPDDTEEISTRIRLREEVASLHLGFSLAERFAAWMTEILSRISSTTPTSPEPSA
jgi:hypothetical protein